VCVKVSLMAESAQSMNAWITAIEESNMRYIKVCVRCECVCVCVNLHLWVL